MTNNLSVSRSYAYLGLTLLGAFLLQYFFALKWNWLEHWQTQNIYKFWSGFAIMIFLLFQWYFPVLLRRRKKSAEIAHHYTLHKQVGAFAPLVYYFHSTQPGYGLLFMLSSAYFTNSLLGVFSYDMIKDRRERMRFSPYWLASHIILSILTITLMVYHIIISFYYE